MLLTKTFQAFQGQKVPLNVDIHYSFITDPGCGIFDKRKLRLPDGRCEFLVCIVIPPMPYLEKNVKQSRIINNRPSIARYNVLTPEICKLKAKQHKTDLITAGCFIEIQFRRFTYKKTKDFFQERKIIISDLNFDCHCLW